MRNNSSPVEDRNAALERNLIDEFLGSRGYSRHLASELPVPEAATLLRAASEYASLRLAEIESKAHYVDEIHRSS
jgi:hypothetical protein